MSNRRCSECGGSLSGKPPQTRTCGTPCRQKRSRRLRRQKVDAAHASHLPEHQKTVSEVVHHEAHEAAHEVMKEELRPIVRDAITEDTLAAIGRLVALTPTVVEKIAEDLESPDSTVRQKAYTLIAKYTIGHPAIVRPPEEESGKKLVVNIGLPRPGDTDDDIVEVSSAEEIQECAVCRADKPLSQFVADSDRCLACHEDLQNRVEAAFGKDAG